MLRRLREMLHTLLMLDDTPHRIALGMAIGLFIAWTPTVGIQMLLSIPITWLARANRIAGLIGVYLSNPFTFLPMYWIDYRLGAIVLKDPLTFAEFQTIVAGDGTSGWLDVFAKVGVELAVPMFVGGIILGAITSVLGYAGTHWLVSRFHRDGNRESLPITSAPGRSDAPPPLIVSPKEQAG